jgi:signal recognition particle subunit SRP19
MKEYESYVFWLDYFNSELKRAGGRRVPLSSATRAPTLDELVDACKRLGLQPSAQPARFPNNPLAASGYVTVPKKKPKQALLLKIAKELSGVRGSALKKAEREKRRQKR